MNPTDAAPRRAIVTGDRDGRTQPDKRAEYLELHASVWPVVEAMNTQCGIRNFTIFIRGDVLFGYFDADASLGVQWQQLDEAWHQD